jgi:hypothetical protein
MAAYNESLPHGIGFLFGEFHYKSAVALRLRVPLDWLERVPTACKANYG